MNNKKGLILSTYVYILLVFFLLLLGTMLLVLNNTKLLSNKLKDQANQTTGLSDKDYSFILLGDKTIIQLIESEYIEPGYRIQTSNGKDLSENVVISGEVDTKTVGEYELTYSATYNGVTKKLTRTVKVIGETGAKYIEYLLSQETMLNNGLMQTYATTDSEKVNAGIRYVGANPNNYVYFNCKDEYTSNSKTIKYGDEDYVYKNNCEVWRIIGVFDTKSSEDLNEVPVKRIKIVRTAFSKGMSWDKSEKENNEGYGVNQWGEIKDTNGNIIYDGADLMRVLNEYYIGKSDICCDISNDGECPAVNNCSSSIRRLSTTSLKMINNSLWNLGATTYDTTIPLSTMYFGERSNQNGKICPLGDNCNDNVTRTTTWVGEIGLIYPSDYGYASTDKGCANDIYGDDSTCNVNNWMYPSSGAYWTISPLASPVASSYAWSISASGWVSNYLTDGTSFVHPTLYLNSSIQIIGNNNGTKENPYILRMPE